MGMRYQNIVCAVAFIACGCLGHRGSEASAKQLMAQISKKVGDFEPAINTTAAAAGSENQAEYVAGLHHRVGIVEELLGDLHYQTQDNAAAQDSIRAIAETVAQMRRITEAKPDEPNLVALREQLNKLKTQLSDCSQKL
jgi:hypothetical protein